MPSGRLCLFWKKWWMTAILGKVGPILVCRFHGLETKHGNWPKWPLTLTWGHHAKLMIGPLVFICHVPARWLCHHKPRILHTSTHTRVRNNDLDTWCLTVCDRKLHCPIVEMAHALAQVTAIVWVLYLALPCSSALVLRIGGLVSRNVLQFDLEILWLWPWPTKWP